MSDNQMETTAATLIDAVVGPTTYSIVASTFPPYPGFPTVTMRATLDTWVKNNPRPATIDETNRWLVKYRDESIRLWRQECESAHAQGLLNGVQMRATRDLVGDYHDDSRYTSSSEYTSSEEDEPPPPPPPPPQRTKTNKGKR